MMPDLLQSSLIMVCRCPWSWQVTPGGNRRYHQQWHHSCVTSPAACRGTWSGVAADHAWSGIACCTQDIHRCDSTQWWWTSYRHLLCQAQLHHHHHVTSLAVFHAPWSGDAVDRAWSGTCGHSLGIHRCASTPWWWTGNRCHPHRI